MYGHFFEARLRRAVDPLFDADVRVFDRDQVEVIDGFVRAAAPVAGASASGGHDDAVPWMHADGRDMGDVQVAAKDEPNPRFLRDFERPLRAPGEVVPRQRNELGQMVMHHEDLQSFARGAVEPVPYLIQLFVCDAPALDRPTKCRIDPLDGDVVVGPLR